jgi:hypothetical protein
MHERARTQQHKSRAIILICMLLLPVVVIVPFPVASCCAALAVRLDPPDNYDRICYAVHKCVSLCALTDRQTLHMQTSSFFHAYKHFYSGAPPL